MNKAVFLDRDGVINKIVYHKDIGVLDTPFTSSQFKLLPKAALSIKNLNHLRFLTILVSNQPGIAKRHFSLKTFKAIEKKMFSELSKGNARLDEVYYCFHHPQAKDKRYRKICFCRKPKPGLLFKAAKDFKIDLKKSYLVGDSITDILAGKKAGCITILLGNHKCDLCKFLEKKKVKPDYIVFNLWEATKIVKKLENL